jgi:hypothetical protein
LHDSSAPSTPAARQPRTISQADAFPDAPTGSPAHYIAGAYVSGRTGTVQFGHANNRPVHGGVYYRGESNDRRAARRRIERQQRRAARKAVRR